MILGVLGMAQKIPNMDAMPVKMNMGDKSVFIPLYVKYLHNSSTRDPALIGLAEGLPKLLERTPGCRFHNLPEALQGCRRRRVP